MKISIIGYSGSGKSTLAKEMAEHYHIPLLYLDTVQFKEDWQDRDREEALGMVKAFMRQPEWVIEGNYTAFVQSERLSVSDYIIFLAYPRLICLLRAFKRYFQYRGRTRESMAEGCREKIDLEFIRWILWDQRDKGHRRHFKEIVDKYNDKVFVVHNQKQLDFLKEKLWKSEII